METHADFSKMSKNGSLVIKEKKRHEFLMPAMRGG